MITIPLRDRTGRVVANAFVDEADVGLAAFKWYRLKSGYVVRTSVDAGRKRMVYLHREVLRLREGDGLLGDHRNGNRLDNRRQNLRVADDTLNARNRRSSRRLARGVRLRRDTGKYEAMAKIDRRPIYLGCYATEDEAAQVARAYRQKHMVAADGLPADYRDAQHLKATHPDHGGDALQFADVQAARGQA